MGKIKDHPEVDDGYTCRPALCTWGNPISPEWVEVASQATGEAITKAKRKAYCLAVLLGIYVVVICGISVASLTGNSGSFGPAVAAAGFQFVFLLCFMGCAAGYYIGTQPDIPRFYVHPRRRILLVAQRAACYRGKWTEYTLTRLAKVSASRQVRGGGKNRHYVYVVQLHDASGRSLGRKHAFNMLTQPLCESAVESINEKILELVPERAAVELMNDLGRAGCCSC